MEDKITTHICTCTFDNGYILSSVLKACAVKMTELQTTFLDNIIHITNTTNDVKLFKNNILDGNEIDLCWDKDIPKEKRNLTIQYNYSELKATLTKILKKDRAKLELFQIRNLKTKDLFDEEGSSDRFSIVIIKEEGDLAGSKQFPATRIQQPTYEVIDPEDQKHIRIPIKQYISLTKEFGKIKGDEIQIRLHKTENGAGITFISTKNKMIQQYGEIEDDDNDKPPIEYYIDSEKMQYLTNIAIHNEGSVIIYYKENCELKLVHKYGSWGVDTTYISSKR